MESNSKAPAVLIVDYGSQYTQLIARSLRELGVRAAVFSLENANKWLQVNRPKAVILSGGNGSVTKKGSPALPNNLLAMDIPVLGICYGMQLLVHSLGGKVESIEEHAEYGPANITLADNLLFQGIQKDQQVWASHTDTASVLPDKFEVIAQSDKYPYAGIYNKAEKIWGLQFHPEVIDTPCGKGILSNFVFGIASCERDWEPKDIISDIRNSLSQLKDTDTVLVAFSGGVDSTVMTAIMSPVLKERLIAVCIDGNHLREGEVEDIQRHADSAGAKLEIIDASEKFQKLVKDTTDAEAKRSAFRTIYKSIFEQMIVDRDIQYIAQGTLATDLIESGQTGGELIKTHHNSNLDFSVNEISPLENLFKYEVRDLSHTLGLPSSVTKRHPFPGPGLFVRIIGAPATTERLNLLRCADKIVTDIIRQDSVFDKISQLVVALDCSKTVGVKGDAREYGYNIVVRAVRTQDFMTAEGVQLPPETRKRISERVPQINGITRVFYDETNKPPATTEFE